MIFPNLYLHQRRLPVFYITIRKKRKAKEEKKKEKKVLKSFGVLTYMLTAFTDNLYYFMCTEFISKQP